MTRPDRTPAKEQPHEAPVRVTDTTLRDAHQSLWATRMRSDDILGIIDVVDQVGYYSLEVWGGATFDVCLRFLREDPWERLKAIRARAKNTPLQMLLRGQNLVGYRNYADDVVERFVALACRNGVDIFRVFDALNDTRNLESAVRAVKKHGGHAQGTLCYAISPVHTIDRYVEYAREQVAIGVDSLCIKDMAGILSPGSAQRLVSALVSELDVPVQLHCHASSGMAVTTYLEGVRAGAGAIDCAVSALAGFSSQPPVETLSVLLDEMDRPAHLDMEAVGRVARWFGALAPERRPAGAQADYIDPDILVHQIPGGMISNFRSQLEMQNALDRLPDVLKEVARVREDLGYPPLVTPTSQIVGTQAVMNVLAGERYKMVPKEVKDYVRGLYGRSPAPISDEMRRKILGDEPPITGRPADRLAPMLPRGTDGIDPKLIDREEDILSYVLLPEPAVEYFKWRALRPEQRGEIPAVLELKRSKQLAKQDGAAANGTSEVSQLTATVQSLIGAVAGLVDEMVQKVGGVTLEEVVLRRGDQRIFVRSTAAPGAPAVPGPVAVAPIAGPVAVLPVAPAANAAVEWKRTINSPLVGRFYASPAPGKPPFVKEGDTVNAGDRVCTVEAMKLFNEIPAPVRCRIAKVLAEDGQPVQKGQPLMAIEEL